MRLFRLSLAALILLSPLAVSAAPNTFQDLANLIVTILDNATTVLIVLGIVVYFYGISTNILKFGEGDKEKFRNYMVWGVIVLFVMVSIWGILRLLQSTLFGDSVSPTDGSSQQAPSDQFGSPHFLE